MASESGAFEIKPMDQFIITPLFSEGDLQWYTFTNQSLWMLIALIGILIGVLLGFGMDYLFNTTPIFLIIMIFLGFAAGVKTMMKTAKEIKE